MLVEKIEFHYDDIGFREPVEVLKALAGQAIDSQMRQDEEIVLEDNIRYQRFAQWDNSRG